MSTILYGSEITKGVRTSLKGQTDELCEKGKRIPKFVVILVRDNPANLSYVTGKEKAYREVGIENILLWLQEDTTEKALLAGIHRLSTDTSVDGILIQLPLPKHMNGHKIPFAIDPLKDVDGFHPYNIGKLMLQEDTCLSCTPEGVLHMLGTAGYPDLSGLRAVVVGRSNIIGGPIVQLLLNRSITVTVRHSRTGNIGGICAEADVLIAFVESPRLVTADWVKKGAVVIDVGINRVDGRLRGDMGFETVEDKMAVAAPVLKSVEPMTIAMFLENTLEFYREHS